MSSKLTEKFKLIFLFFVLVFYVNAWAIETYERHVSYLNSYLSQIRSKESYIRDLIKKKNQTTDPKALEQIIAEMVSVDKELQGLRVKYEEELNTVKYKFPEKGEQNDRKYQKIKKDTENLTEDQIDQQKEIDSRLKKVKKKIEDKLDAPNDSEKYEVRKVDKKNVKTRQERDEEDSEKVILVK